MPRRRRDDEDDEPVEEDDQPDELERAEAALAAKRKEKGKSSSSSKDKGKKKSSKDNDARRNNASDEENEASDEENAASTRKGKSKMSDKDVTGKARELVRFAICNEASKRLLKRDEINKKVLAGNTRAFAQVFSKANILLQNNFGMELVELFPQNSEEPAEKPKKKNAAQAENEDEGDEGGSDEEGEGEGRKKKKKPQAKKDSDKPKKGSAKAFCLRTTLDDEILQAAIAPDTNIENDTMDRRELDATGSLGDAASVQLQEWKQGDDAIFDWKTGPEQRTLMGILYAILSLILVKERVLTDEQLLTHLKNINLRLETPLPLNPTALRPEKQTLNTFLSVLINRNMAELVYASFRGIRLSYADSADNQSVRFSIKWIQIDNQLFGGIFPLLLYPSVIPRDGKELEVHPNLQVAVTLLKSQAHGVLYFKYASILLQEMTVEVDEDFLFALLDFTKLRGTTGDAPPPSLLSEDETKPLPDEPEAVQSTDVYFESLELQPVQLDLSFMRTETLNSDSDIFQSNRNAVAYFLNAVTMALGNVNDAPIRLNALIVSDVRCSYAVLAQRVMLHYQQEFVNQLYRVLGSADFLGNPIGLFSNVSSGVADLFYEPTEGVVEFRDFGAGLARGAGSFVKKTVFGVTDSMTKVTGSIGKGLSAATLDKQFQSQRRMRQYRNKPRHALYGVAAGAGSLVSSVASGFEGLARKPIEGAEAGGAAGFIKGIGKGVVGFATKPVVGMFDLASNVTEGIRNTTTVFDQSSIDKVRLPRTIPHDKVLRPFNEREALGQFWLKNLENGRFFNDYYIAHLAISGDNANDLIVLLTTDAVILARVTKLKVMWHVPLGDLQSISLEPNGISLSLRGGARGPFLALPDQESRLWFFSHVERVVTSHNLQRRFE